MKNLICLVFFLCSLTAQTQDVFNDCPMEGNAQGAADKQTNRLKNRYTIPTQADIDPRITLEALLRPGNDEGRFQENKAAQITGYVVNVNLRGSKETCNCHATQPIFTDTHIDIVLDPNHAGKRERVVVEVTPRIRAMMATRGEDWSHQALKELEGKRVTFTGWLLWDWRHKKDAENTDPGDAAQNWRATCWELHPVTSFEVLDDPTVLTSADGSEDEGASPIIFTPSPEGGSSSTAAAYFQPDIKTKDASSLLTLILLGAVLGMAGQVIRLIVGLKKAKSEALQKQKEGTITDLLQLKQLFLGLMIAIIIGGIAGLLASINMDGSNLTNSAILAMIGAGYAGTDFIEGFVLK